MNRDGMRTTVDRFVNVITFIDLPIGKKFFLFALGVMFWFVAMFAVIVTAMYDLKGKSETIVNRVLPQERTAQAIITNLQQVIIATAELARSDSPEEIMKGVESSASRLDRVTTLVGSLKETDAVAARTQDRGGFRLAGGIFPEAVAGESEVERYLAEIAVLATAAERQFKTLAALKLASVSGRFAAPPKMEVKLAELRRTLERSIVLSGMFASKVGDLYAINTARIGTSIHYALVLSVAVLCIASSLLVLFTFWISRSIARPVNSMIEQIRQLSRGDVDLSGRIAISSKDEIGTLSAEFNGLMEAIYDMNNFKKVIEEDDSLEDVYARLGRVISVQNGFDAFTIYEVSNSKNRLKPVQPVLLPGDKLPCSGEILDNCDLCKAKKTGRIVSSLAYPGICKQYQPESGQEHCCVPMIVGGSTGGVVQFRFPRPTDDAEAVDVERRLFRARQYLTESIAVIEAKRLMVSLQDSALKDPLTGLRNRRFLQEYTDSLVAGIRRRGKNIGLIMCDLDYFKQVNDVHGHNAGDAVLKETSLLISRSVRDADVVIRFGGEEFLVVLVDVQVEDTLRVAEKIRANVENARIKVPHGAVVAKTISLGVSEFPTDTESFWQAIKFADVALYKAKEAGRNRVVRYAEGMWSEPQF